MDATTFGSSTAAATMVQMLLRADSPYLTRKVSCKMHDFMLKMNDVNCSNMPATLKRWAINHAYDDFKVTMEQINHPVKTFALNVGKAFYQEHMNVLKKKP